jgi:hypothetical protein
MVGLHFKNLKKGPKTRIRHDEKANQIHPQPSPQCAPARISQDPQRETKNKECAMTR